MDIVTISGNMLGKSSYFTGTGYPCARILDAMDDFSPGFERRFLKYFPLTTVTKIEYVLTGIQTPQETGSCQVPLINPVVTTDISVDTSGMSLPGEYIIHILDIEYDPEGSDTNNEKITLLATNSSGNQEPLDLSKVFRLRVNGNNKTLPWILPMNVPTTFTKTFGFPNSTDDGQAVIITLTYGEYVFASYTYNPNTTKLLVLQEEKKENITGDLFSTGITLDISGLQFIIQYVLPNPK